MCGFFPKINKRLICDHSLREMSVCAAAFTTVFSLVGMGMHYHGMHNPNVTQISYYKEYHTIICIIIICTFGFLFVSSIVFAIGIQEQWPLLYIPWLMAYTMVTVLVLAQLVYLIVDNFLLPHILLGFQACINIFAIWIGCNFYEETREKGTHQSINQAIVSTKHSPLCYHN
ncbi:uncharacterized protein LOC111062761 isoform X1 [Nilaparvata lugens]|uniref:uncharacterized protein LOC111062761 isoform X1 n=1 Tax=Nilaparvata lugens TaxID=108931 RepID=UPI000B998BDB|nr:uncharacterized protein LOC111062761 isoform X1 [Nilaparvata lugens]